MDMKELMENVNETKKMIGQSKILIGDIIHSIYPITNTDGTTISIETVNNIMKIKDLTNNAEKLMDNIKFNGQQESTGITNGIKIVNWSDGSWKDITKMLDAHYRGIINITDYWKTGDIREVELSTGEILYLTLIGKNHDNLANPINGITKAAFTVDSKYCLKTTKQMFLDYVISIYSLWSESIVRTYLNGLFRNSLPRELRDLIKTVTKDTYRYNYEDYDAYLYRGSITTQEDVFILSETEVYGKQLLGTETSYGRGKDGIQYEYYKDKSNRIKCLKENNKPNTCWLRTSVIDKGGNSNFRIVGKNGNPNLNKANNSSHIVPAFCI